jgi:hypothetical protein
MEGLRVKPHRTTYFGVAPENTQILPQHAFLRRGQRDIFAMARSNWQEVAILGWSGTPTEVGCGAVLCPAVSATIETPGPTAAVTVGDTQLTGGATPFQATQSTKFARAIEKNVSMKSGSAKSREHRIILGMLVASIEVA